MKSEFYWGLLSSFFIAILVSIIQSLGMIRSIHREGGQAGVGVGFTLLPFVCIYFIVGVVMLFIKTSEKFAKGLLLSSLILFFLMFVLTSGLTGI